MPAAFWWGVVAGVIVESVGVVALCLCVSARRGDEIMARAAAERWGE